MNEMSGGFVVLNTFLDFRKDGLTMSEENDYSLLTKDEQKKLHEKLFGPITDINVYLKDLKDNKGKLLETLEEIKLEGGVEKLIGLRNEIEKEWLQLPKPITSVQPLPFADDVDNAVTRQVIGELWQLRRILNLLIFADQSESMSSAMFNLQINRADFFTHALNEDGWVPDKFNDEDGTEITLSDLLKAERNHKKADK